MQGSGAARYFDVAIDECNVTQTQVPGGLSLSVTLIPASGSLVFAGDPLPTFICGCFYDSLATVGTVAAVEVQTETRDITGGTASFNATMQLYPDDGYDQPLAAMGAFPTTSSRFFLEITTDNVADVVGVPNCTVAPTNAADDPYRMDLRALYCDVEAFTATQIPVPGAAHVVRWSVAKFKFAGHNAVFIRCVVVRCATAPCGTCGGRRLEGRRQQATEEQGAPTLATAAVVLPPGEYLILPSAVTEAEGSAARGSTNASSTPPQAAPETRGAAATSVVVTAVVVVVVLLLGIAAISTFVVWRRKHGKERATRHAASMKNEEAQMETEGAKTPAVRDPEDEKAQMETEEVKNSAVQDEEAQAETEEVKNSAVQDPQARETATSAGAGEGAAGEVPARGADGRELLYI